MTPTVKLIITFVSIYAAFWHFASTSIHAKPLAPAPPALGQLVQQQQLTASDAASVDQFGRVVAVSGDTAIVGAFAEDNSKGNNAGAAYVYVRSGSVWTLQQKLIASDGAAGDLFGFSVAIDGDSALIGAESDATNLGQGTGSAYLFTRTGGVWTEQQRLQASDGALNDGFGYSLSLNGETAVISSVADDDGGQQAGSAYIFTSSGGVWTQQQRIQAGDAKAGANFGHSTSLNNDTLVIGAWQDNNLRTAAGAAYVFIRNGSVWTQQQKLMASDPGSNDFFGTSVSLSGDTIIVGASSNDGNDTDAGAAYVFTRNNGSWTQQQRLNASDFGNGDNFGSSVSTSGDMAVVGAFLDSINGSFGAGSAYVFTRSGTVWTQQQKIFASDGAANDHFGLALALNGATVIIGAPDDDHPGASDAGSAYIFVPEIPNTPPLVDAGADQTATEDAVFNLTASFTDSDLNDTHTATINWGDGSPAQAATVTEPSGSNPGALNASHTYLASGSYQITVTVTDAANASASDTLQVTVVEAVSNNYIQNTTGTQPNANFNISGGGVIGGDLTVNGTLHATGSALTDLNATNITAGTIDNARLGLIPATNIADNAISTTKLADAAVTAPKIGTNQVVKSLNGLTDTVNLSAGANVTITPSGNTLTIAAAGGGAPSQWTTSGSNIFYNLGKVGIGSVSPDVSLQVHHSSSNTNLADIQLADLVLALRNTSNTDGNMNLISFQDSFGWGNAQIGAIQTSQTNHAADLVFITRNPGNLAAIERLRIKADGKVVLNTLGTAGSTQLCRNASNQIATCSSSLRYKTQIAPFTFGLNLVERLRPITFNWIADGTKDIGFGAEEVAAVDPLFVTYNANGEVEGVKYDRISVVLVNAINEQQKQIEAQQNQLKQQQGLIEALKLIVCKQNLHANICR